MLFDSLKKFSEQTSGKLIFDYDLKIVIVIKIRDHD